MSTVLFLVGYALALPIGLRLGQVVAQQHRMALAGHQLGLIIAALGWLLRGRVLMTVVHILFAIGVRIWFSHRGSQNNSR